MNQDVSIEVTLRSATDKTRCADFLTLALVTAVSPTQVLESLHARDYRDIVFALKQSLTSDALARIPLKLATRIYNHVNAALNRKEYTAWFKIRELLKRIPQDALVTLAFLVTVGRTLDSNNMTIDGLSAGVWLLRDLWPQVEIREVADGDVEEGDAVSSVLLKYGDDLLGEVPGEVRAVNCRFGSRAACELMGFFADEGGIRWA